MKPIPNADRSMMKEEFEKRYRNLLGDRFDNYCRYSFSYLTRSIRINTIKADIGLVRKRLNAQGWHLDLVPFAPNGFWVEHEDGRLDIGNTREHALGYFYVQEAASMVPPLVLDPRPGEIVLDMCAAPGSKTTQIAQYMENEGILVANDYTGQRMAPLVMNLQRMGITNTMTTKMYGQWFGKKNIEFDKVLVDAPCSGTGTIRKSLKTLRIWNPTMIERLASTQKKLISAGFEVLRPGGIMVYSTCSTEPLEDEAVVSYLLEKYDDAQLLEIELDIKRSEPLTEFDGLTFRPEVKKTLRLWPQDNDTEGFFVAKITKTH